jgi:hypothetical protein
MWFRSVFDCRNPQSRRTRLDRRRSARLVCEVLEARCLLSYTLTDLGAFPVTGNSHAEVGVEAMMPLVLANRP